MAVEAWAPVGRDHVGENAAALGRLGRGGCGAHRKGDGQCQLHTPSRDTHGSIPLLKVRSPKVHSPEAVWPEDRFQSSLAGSLAPSFHERPCPCRARARKCGNGLHPGGAVVEAASSAALDGIKRGMGMVREGRDAPGLSSPHGVSLPLWNALLPPLRLDFWAWLLDLAFGPGLFSCQLSLQMRMWAGRHSFNGPTASLLRPGVPTPRRSRH